MAMFEEAGVDSPVDCPPSEFAIRPS